MTFTLVESLFKNNVYSVDYGMRKATFTIVDEDFLSGASDIKVSRMICDIKTYDGTGALVDEVFGSLVIGLGDANVSVTSTDPALLGTVMTKANMASCTVELHE